MKKLFALCLLSMPTIAMANTPLGSYQATCLVAKTSDPAQALGHATISLAPGETAEVFKNSEFAYSVTRNGHTSITLKLERGGRPYSAANVWLGSEFPPQIDLIGNAGLPITMSCVTQ